MTTPSNPFILDDAPTATASTSSSPSNPFILDNAESSGGAEDPPVSAHPVTDELMDLPKHLLRGTIEGVGKLIDLPENTVRGVAHATGQDQPGTLGGEFMNAAGLNDPSNHPMAHLVAEKLADRLQQAVPSLAPKQNGSLGKDIEAGAENVPMAAIAGPEAVIPNFLSGAASQEAANRGYGPVGQTIASALPLTPSLGAATVRGAVRGPSGAEMTSNLADAKNAGINLSAGEAANNTLLRGVETATSKLPGGGPVKATRGQGMSNQIEQSVSNTVSNLAPNLNQKPPTQTMAGDDIAAGVEHTIQSLKGQTSSAKDTMETAVGGKDTPVPAKSLQPTIDRVTSSTGDDTLDNWINGAKTKQAAKAAGGVELPSSSAIPTNYGAGAGHHAVSSPNGSTLAADTPTGDLQVTQSMRSPGTSAEEDSARMAAMADAARGQGKTLHSQPANAIAPEDKAAFESLKDKGYTVKQGTNPTDPAYSVAPRDPSPWTFDSLRAFRTKVGQALETAKSTQRGQLSQLYGAASDDLRSFVRGQGPQAEQAYNDFNTTAGKNADTQKILNDAVDKAGGNEAVFKAAMSGGKDGATKVTPVFNSMNSDGQNLFRATVLHRLGRLGGAVDADFDPDIFLRNWKGMAPEAKDLLFNSTTPGSAPGQLRAGLDSLTRTIDLLKSQGIVKSGLSKAVQQGVSHSTMGGLIALIGERAASMGYHLASGNPLAAAGSGLVGAGILGASPILSRVLTNPRIVSWLAQSTRVPASALPIMLNQLNQMGNRDPDAKDLAQLISQEGNR